MSRSITIGCRCLKDDASIESMNIWKTLKVHRPYLICPCKITPTAVLIVQEILNGRYALVNMEKAPGKVAVLCIKDLRRIG